MELFTNIKHAFNLIIIRFIEYLHMKPIFYKIFLSSIVDTISHKNQLYNNFDVYSINFQLFDSFFKLHLNEYNHCQYFLSNLIKRTKWQNDKMIIWQEIKISTNLEVVSEIMFPFFLQVMSGSGSPVATHKKAAMPPARTIWSLGASRITGGS